MKKTFVIICLDGFKYDYLKKTNFLNKLAENGQHGELNHGFGYASEYSAITGKDTKDLEIIANFYYHPKSNFYSTLSLIDSLPFKKNLRFFLDLIYNSKEFLIGNNQPKSIFNIPLKYSKYFDYSIKKNIFEEKFKYPSIFELLRQKRKKVSGYMWPFIFKNNKSKIDFLNISKNTADTDNRAFKKSIQLLKKKPDICYIHFFSTDNLVHKSGTNSKKTNEIIKILDKYVEKINNYADKILIFSDHGMIDVTEILDIQKIINQTGLVFEKDYIMFLDSTLARFWFFNETARRKIKDLFLNLKKGKIIYFKNKKIHKKFGELVFQVNPGILILPNFYQSTADKAMHGYSGESNGEKGFYIFSDKTKNNKKEIKKDMEIKEIFNLVISNA